MKTKIKLVASAAAFIAAGHFMAFAATPPTADLSLWLKADAGLTLNGSAVSEWADQSGLNHSAYQSTAANQPAFVTTQLGISAVRFDGANDFMLFTNNINNLEGITIFLVSNNQNPAQTGGSGRSDNPAIIWNETKDWGWVFLSPFQSTVTWRFGTGSSTTATNGYYARPASVGNAYTITTLKKDWEGEDPLETLYVNGTAVQTIEANATSTSEVREDGMLGGRTNSYFAGDILEVLVYNAALSDTDRGTVEAYLNEKYFSNELPTVAITSPTPSTPFTGPTDITIMADALDDGAVASVEFFVNGTSIGTDTTPPYTAAWNNVAPGGYTLSAKVTDDQGAWNTTKSVARVGFANPQDGPPMADMGLWYKADAGVTANAGKVSAWADQSGFESHASQTSATLQPTLVTAGNGKPAVSFDGLRTFMNFASIPMDGLSRLTVVLVMNNNAPQSVGAAGTGTAAIYWGGSLGWGGLAVSVFQDTANWRIGTTQNQNGSPNYPGPAHTRPESIQRNYSRTVVIKDGTSEMLYTNGVLATTVTGKLATTLGINQYVGYLGRGELSTVWTYLNGEIQEILVYTNALSSTDLANMETYLTAKYWADAQPAVAITSPANNTAFTAPANITITAAPSDADGTITKVEFFDSGTLIGTVTSAPWEIAINAGKGTHTFTAKATDNDGLVNYSAPVLAFGNAASGFALVENFETRTPGPVIFQGDWNGAFPDDTVVAGTPTFPGTNAANKALLQIRNNQAISFPLLIKQGTTATLFFQAASTTWSKEEIILGLSDNTAVGFAHFLDPETEMIRYTGGSLINKMVGVRYDGVLYTNLANFKSDVWYKMWMVADNAADTWKLYIQGDPYTVPTPVANGAVSTFGFKNGTANNDLIRLLLRTGATSRTSGGFWIDDIYLAQGENLSDPTIVPPEPPTLSIARSGDDVVISWPAAETGYALEATGSLQTPSWSNVPETPVQVGDQMTVTLPASAAPKYLRLKK